MLNTIKQLFLAIFDSKNHINTWGSFNDIISILEQYDSVFFHGHHSVEFNDLRQYFKCWYNQTFPHNLNCHQILDYNDIDGSLCSCTHRPLQSLDEKWKLDLAMGYTFREYLDMENDDNDNGLHQCLAITTLSIVIEKQWTYEQIQKYIQDQHLRRKIILSFTFYRSSLSFFL